MNLTLLLPIDRLPLDGSNDKWNEGKESRSGGGARHDEQEVVPEREFTH